jgi:outer membrane protein assembly factor BamB
MNPTLIRIILASGILVTGYSAGLGSDWYQYRGSNGDGTAAEKILTSWPAEGPKRLWTVKTPAGFSSFSAAAGKVFTVVSRDIDGAPTEVCVAFDAVNGKELWASPTGAAKYRSGGDTGAPGNTGGDGPRSTPAVSDGRVYVYSSAIMLHCLDAATGKPLWKKDMRADFHGRNIDWESAMSPVIDGELLFIAGGGPGQAMLAFNKVSGEVVWQTGDDAMTHATPVLANIHGVRQVIFMMQSGLVALEARTGKPLWRFSFPYRIATGCSPVVAGDIVICAAGYDIGGAACQVTQDSGGFQAKELWRSKGNNPLGDLWSTPVQKDGYLYGMISFKKFGQGPLKCVDVKTGEVKWEQPGFGAGNVVLAAGYLIALSDTGEIVVAKASPDSYQEVARAKAIEGKCWSTPALSNGRLYIRSTKEGACFDLGIKS